MVTRGSRVSSSSELAWSKLLRNQLLRPNIQPEVPRRFGSSEVRSQNQSCRRHFFRILLWPTFSNLLDRPSKFGRINLEGFAKRGSSALEAIGSEVWDPDLLEAGYWLYQNRSLQSNTRLGAFPCSSTKWYLLVYHSRFCDFSELLYHPWASSAVLATAFREILRERTDRAKFRLRIFCQVFA